MVVSPGFSISGITGTITAAAGFEFASDKRLDGIPGGHVDYRADLVVLKPEQRLGNQVGEGKDEGGFFWVDDGGKGCHWVGVVDTAVSDP